MSCSNNVLPYDHPFNVGLRANSPQLQKPAPAPASSTAAATTSKSTSYAASLIKGIGYLYQNAPVGTVTTLVGAAAGYALSGSGIGTLVCAAAGYCLPSILSKLSQQAPSTAAPLPISAPIPRAQSAIAAPKTAAASPMTAPKMIPSAPNTSNALLIPFYQGKGATASNAALEQILSWTDQRLEAQHDYIQWLFPLASASRYNLNAPVLDVLMQSALRKDPVIQSNFLRAFDRMLKFYGFKRNPDGSIVPAANFAARFQEWGTAGNHNFLRITRILTSLRLMGHAAQATLFYQALQRYTNGVDPKTISIWYSAQN